MQLIIVLIMFVVIWSVTSSSQPTRNYSRPSGQVNYRRRTNRMIRRMFR